MNYRSFKNRLEYHKYYHGLFKALHKDKSELFEVWVRELKFSNMGNEFLLNSLREIKAFADDKLIEKAIDNMIERYNLDKLIHVRTIFWKNDRTKS